MSQEARKLVGCVVVVSLLVGVVSVGSGLAFRRSRHSLVGLGEKVSPLVAREVLFLVNNPQYDHRLPFIVQIEKELYLEEVSRWQLRDRSARLDLIHSIRGEFTAREIAALVSDRRVERIALDSIVRANAVKSRPTADIRRNSSLATIGADQAQDLGFDGTGVTVAVFDSGIQGHRDLGDRIRLSVDFTQGDPIITSRNVDNYGHGTHVAGIIAGDGTSSGGLYRGVAPGASLIDIKVVGDDGMGRTSHLIRAIEWLRESHEDLGVRVANFSVSRPPTEAFYEDPLCEAVRLLVDSGVVAVASSGNFGRTERYPEIWGGITSPGIDPAVITVYPLNARNTAAQDDDVATSYGVFPGSKLSH